MSALTPTCGCARPDFTLEVALVAGQGALVGRRRSQRRRQDHVAAGDRGHWPPTGARSRVGRRRQRAGLSLAPAPAWGCVFQDHPCSRT